jgi:alpha-glucoside transport system substrate-binding protein
LTVAEPAMRRSGRTQGVEMHITLKTARVVASVLLVGVAAHGGSVASATVDTEIGGSISVLGVLSGDNLEAFLSAFAPFEEETGISIEYEGTFDLLAVLQTRIDGGNPPDIVSNPSAGQMQTLASAGELVALDDIVDIAAVEADFPSSLVELSTVGDSLYGIPGTTAVAGLVWYNPTQYDGPTDGTLDDLAAWTATAAADGRTPFCIGLESGPVSGWPGASFIQQFMLQQSGADAYNRWWQGELAWTSPEVRQAFESFGAYATDDAFVAGGPTAALTTNFATAGVGLFDDPPSCYLHVQGDWLGNAMVATVPDIEPVTDVDFFLFPAASADVEPGIVTSGETFGAFTDTPQTRAFLQYVAGSQFSELIAATGLWIGPNRQTPPESYTSVLSRQAAEAYQNADTVVFGAQDGMPAAMSTAFHEAVMSYVADPASLDDILAGLDEIQQTAYAGG